MNWSAFTDRSRRSSREMMESGLVSNSSAATYRLPSSNSTRTTVRWVAGWPSCGSRWVKLEMVVAVAQAGSLR